MNGNICNICGKQADKASPVIYERLGYGSRHDEQTHEVRFCASCFENTVKSCKIPTEIDAYIDAKNKPLSLDDVDENDCLPGEYCNKCGNRMLFAEANDRLVAQGAIQEQKHKIQFCHKCFDNIIKSCVHTSLVKNHNAS